MKKQTDKLFDLVKSLTKNEKRFFKLYSNFYSQEKDKNYLILFDLLEGLKTYNEKVILAHNPKQISTKNLSQVKAYLKKHIFLSLKLFHRNNYKTVQHYDDLGLVSLLMERGELVEAEKLLNKMQKKCTDSKNIQGLSEIKFTLWQLTIRKEVLDQKYFEEELEIVQDLEQVLNAYHIKVKMKALFSEVRFFTETLFSFELSHDEKIKYLLENKLLLIDYSQLPDAKSKITYLQSLMVAYYYLARTDKFEFYAKKMFALIEKNPESFNQYEYCIALSSLMRVYAMTNNKVALFETIKKFDDIIKIHPYLEMFLTSKIEALCTYHSFYPEKPISTSLLQLIDTFFNKDLAHLEANLYIASCLHIAQLYFYRKRYKEAQETLDKSLLRFRISIKNEYFIPIHILNILCYFELNNQSFAQRELTNFKRKLKREEVFNTLITTLVKQIAIIIKKPEQPFKADPYLKIMQIFEDNKERKFFKFNLQFLNAWAIENIKKHQS